MVMSESTTWILQFPQCTGLYNKMSFPEVSSLGEGQFFRPEVLPLGILTALIQFAWNIWAGENIEWPSSLPSAFFLQSSSKALEANIGIIPKMQSMSSLLSSTRGTRAFTNNTARSQGFRSAGKSQRSPCLLVRAENVLIINTKGEQFYSHPKPVLACSWPHITFGLELL